MAISLIVATGLNGEIGLNNKLLFECPTDLRYFKSKTENNWCVMGSKTFNSLPKPFGNGRTNVVVSRNEDFYIDPHLKNKYDILLVNNLEKVINHYNSGVQERELFICGGSEIYKQSLPHVDKVYLTLFHHEKEADTFFSLNYIKEHFEIIDKEEYEVDGLRFDFIEYIRKIREEA